MVGIMRIAVLGAVLAASPAWAQVYKWVDEQGRTHYGEKPPASKAAPVTLRDPTGGPRPDAPQQSLEQKEGDFQQRRIERERDAEKEAQRARAAERSPGDRAYRCRVARNDVLIMDRFSTSYTFKQQAEARDRVARYCR